MKDNDSSNMCSTNGVGEGRFYREVSAEGGKWGKNRLQMRDNIKMNL